MYSTTTQDYSTQTRPTLAVVPEHRTRWQAALIRATERRLDVRPDQAGLADDGGRVHRYRVASFSQPGRWHVVTVAAPSDGSAPVVACDCDAGRVPIPCQHAAVGLDVAGVWPFPIARQQQLMAPPPRYRAGDEVRVVRSGKRGRVSYNSLADGTWMYLVNGSRGAALGVFLGSELEPVAAASGPSAADTAALFLAGRERRVAS